MGEVHFAVLAVRNFSICAGTRVRPKTSESVRVVKRRAHARAGRLVARGGQGSGALLVCCRGRRKWRGVGVRDSGLQFKSDENRCKV